ncbi:MAG: outer membrane beta-barrel protein [Coprobacter sp.]|nr:outer membrane beta-barrel protein [Coprobacter sp.]
MKKALFTMIVLCLMATATYAQQAKGEMAAKVHTGMTIEAGALQGIIGFEYRVAVADSWRIAPNFNIGGGRGLKFLDLTVDAHYVFRAADNRFSFYPIAGVGFYHTWYKVANFKTANNRIFANVGIGGQYDLTDNIGITAEVKNAWMADYNKGSFLVGCCYKF